MERDQQEHHQGSDTGPSPEDTAAIRSQALATSLTMPRQPLVPTALASLAVRTASRALRLGNASFVRSRMSGWRIRRSALTDIRLTTRGSLWSAPEASPFSQPPGGDSYSDFIWRDFSPAAIDGEPHTVSGFDLTAASRPRIRPTQDPARTRQNGRARSQPPVESKGQTANKPLGAQRKPITRTGDRKGLIDKPESTAKHDARPSPKGLQERVVYRYVDRPSAATDSPRPTAPRTVREAKAPPSIHNDRPTIITWKTPLQRAFSNKISGARKTIAKADSRPIIVSHTWLKNGDVGESEVVARKAVASIEGPNSAPSPNMVPKNLRNLSQPTLEPAVAPPIDRSEGPLERTSPVAGPSPKSRRRAQRAEAADSLKHETAPSNAQLEPLTSGRGPKSRARAQRAESSDTPQHETAPSTAQFQPLTSGQTHETPLQGPQQAMPAKQPELGGTQGGTLPAAQGQPDSLVLRKQDSNATRLEAISVGETSHDSAAGAQAAPPIESLSRLMNARSLAERRAPLRDAMSDTIQSPALTPPAHRTTLRRTADPMVQIKRYEGSAVEDDTPQNPSEASAQTTSTEPTVMRSFLSPPGPGQVEQTRRAAAPEAEQQHPTSQTSPRAAGEQALQPAAEAPQRVESQAVHRALPTKVLRYVRRRRTRTVEDAATEPQVQGSRVVATLRRWVSFPQHIITQRARPTLAPPLTKNPSRSAALSPRLESELAPKASSPTVEPNTQVGMQPLRMDVVHRAVLSPAEGDMGANPSETTPVGESRYGRQLPETTTGLEHDSPVAERKRTAHAEPLVLRSADSTSPMAPRHAEAALSEPRLGDTPVAPNRGPSVQSALHRVSRTLGSGIKPVFRMVARRKQVGGTMASAGSSQGSERHARPAASFGRRVRSILIPQKGSDRNAPSVWRASSDTRSGHVGAEAAPGPTSAVTPSPWPGLTLPSVVGAGARAQLQRAPDRHRTTGKTDDPNAIFGVKPATPKGHKPAAFSPPIVYRIVRPLKESSPSQTPSDILRSVDGVRSGSNGTKTPSGLAMPGAAEAVTVGAGELDSGPFAAPSIVQRAGAMPIRRRQALESPASQESNLVEAPALDLRQQLTKKDFDFLASKIYVYLRNRLSMERERHGRPGYALR